MTTLLKGQKALPVAGIVILNLINAYLILLNKGAWYFPVIVFMGLVYISIGFFVVPTAFGKVKELFSELSWVHFLWILMFTTPFMVTMRSVYQLTENAVDTIRLIRITIVLTVATIIFLVMLKKRGVLRKLFRGLIGVMAFYGMIIFSSGFYSPFPLLTFWKAFEVIISILLIALILSNPFALLEVRKLINLIWILLSVLMFIVWIEALLFPVLAFRNLGSINIQLRGILPIVHPNRLGQIGAILGVVCLCRVLQSKQRWAAALYSWLLFLSMATVILAHARVSIVAFPVAAAVVLLLHKRVGWIGFTFLLSIGLLLIPEVFDYISRFFVRGQDIDLFMSMSNRTNFWKFAWNRIQQSPVYGYGFYAGHRIINAPYGEYGSNMDNTFVEVLLDVGIIGFVPIVIAFIGAWKGIISCISKQSLGEPSEQWKSLTIELIGVMVIITFRSLTGPTFQMNDMNLLIFLSILAYAQKRRNLRKGEAVIGNVYSSPYP